MGLTGVSYIFNRYCLQAWIISHEYHDVHFVSQEDSVNEDKNRHEKNYGNVGTITWIPNSNQFDIRSSTFGEIPTNSKRNDET